MEENKTKWKMMEMLQKMIREGRTDAAASEQS